MPRLPPQLLVAGPLQKPLARRAGKAVGASATGQETRYHAALFNALG